MDIAVLTNHVPMILMLNKFGAQTKVCGKCRFGPRHKQILSTRPDPTTESNFFVSQRTRKFETLESQVKVPLTIACTEVDGKCCFE